MAYSKKADPLINEEIQSYKDNKYIFTNLYHHYSINAGQYFFKKDSILDNYYDVIMAECVDVDLSEMSEYAFERTYKYRPKSVSLKIYGTIDLWWLVLYVNSMASVREFNRTKIKLFAPSSMDILNKILILENDKLISTRKNPTEIIV